MRTRTVLPILLGLALGSSVPSAHGLPPTPEQSCRKARLDASAKYLACQYRTFAKVYSTSYFPDWDESIGRCTMDYQATWAKLQATPSLAGTSCTQPRLVDNGDGTVTDNLTGLVWEQKTDDGGIHDKDRFFAFSSGPPWKDDGTIFTTFLPALNDGSFGGSRGWRLPSVAELVTLLLAPYPCEVGGACIDPVFGPASMYWYVTANSPPPPAQPDEQWFVGPYSAEVSYYYIKGSALPVRAVRGGW